MWRVMMMVDSDEALAIWRWNSRVIGASSESESCRMGDLVCGAEKCVLSSTRCAIGLECRSSTRASRVRATTRHERGCLARRGERDWALGKHGGGRGRE